MKMKDMTCAVEGCENKARTRYLCSTCYRRGHVRGTFDPAELAGPRRQRERRVFRRKDRDGYWLVWAGGSTWLREHRVVMEEKLGRPLEPDEVVHHKNGVRDDNRPENLELCLHIHPRGQRVADLIAWAEELLVRYERERQLKLL
jgi:hypothetical protein